MAGNALNLDTLSAKLKENIADYSKIMTIRMANGFGIKKDPLFTLFNIRDKVPLIRELTEEMVQPGRTGTTNFKGGVSLKDRWGVLTPWKVDLKLDEKTLYGYLKSYPAKKKPQDSSDIYSFPAMNYVMDAIQRRIGKDTHKTIFNGVFNAADTSAVSIADGLKLLFTQGVATSGTGAVGDIPTDNVVTAAATINETNILSEIKKLAQRVYESLDEPEEESATLFIDPLLAIHLQNALDSALSNNSQVVTKKGDKLVLNIMPNTTLETRSWIKSSSGMVWTPNGNLAALCPEDTTEDVPSISVEKADRNIKIFIDGELGYNYCDGRLIFMNSKVIA